MQEIQLLDAIERYLRGEMNSEELAAFEQLRKSNAEVDERVVEHTMFLQQIDQFSDWKNFRSSLHDVHNLLLGNGDITEAAPKATVRELWKRYKRIVAVAASIAGITAISISIMAYYFTPNGSMSEIRQLSQQLNEVKNSQKQTSKELFDLKKSTHRPTTPAKVGGTGFLIDGKGYLVTSAHVVVNADSVYVQNTKGDYYKVATIYSNKQTDIAVLKITDSRFVPFRSLPYTIQKSQADLGEEIFTLGFPRPSSEVVYNRGYLSASTGYNGDTLTYQIAITANPGNSGGPIFNEFGDVIGILSGKQITAEGVVFSSKSKNIFSALSDIKKDTTHNERIKLPSSSYVQSLSRTRQIKKIEDCVFMVKSY
jgi:Trypsin-like serine proteases, typically periplasmic, contain C-terminal PDZ domain